MNNYLSEKLMFFKQENLSHITNIPLGEPSINNVLSTSIWVDINEINLIQTDKGVSNKGDIITGAKLMVQLKIEGKITYVSEEPRKSVHGMKFETIKSMAIILPKEHLGKNILTLYRENKISVVPYVEGFFSRKVDSNNIYTSMIIFLDASIYS